MRAAKAVSISSLVGPAGDAVSLEEVSASEDSVSDDDASAEEIGAIEGNDEIPGEAGLSLLCCPQEVAISITAQHIAAAVTYILSFICISPPQEM